MQTALALLLLAARPLAALAADANAELGIRALSILRASMDSTDPELRILAAQQWGELGNRAVVPALKSALADKNRYVRIAAADNLNRLGDASWLPAIEAIVSEGAPSARPGAKPSPTEELKAIAHSKLRVAAIRVYAQAKDPAVEEKLRRLKSDPDPAVKDAARVALARLGSSEDLEKFVAALDSEEAAQRLTAVRRLGDIGTAAVALPLQKTSKDADAQVRAATMASMGMSGDASVIPHLSQGTDDRDQFVRSNAVEALSRLALPQSKTHLRLAYERAPTAFLKLQAAKGLARLGERVDLALIGRSAAHKDLDTRLLAVEVLEAVEGEEASDILQLVLDDTNSRLKARAAAALLKRLKAPSKLSPKGGKP